MKFCGKCGNEIPEDTNICGNCGCEVSTEEGALANKKQEKKKSAKIILMIIAAVSAIALLVAGFFVYNHVRTEKVIDDLSGRKFFYYDMQSYPALGKVDYTTKEMDFAEDGTLTYSYYFSNIDSGNEYQRSYKIKFKGDMIILEMGADEYEVIYDKYDRISGIYDIIFDELYE